MTGVTETSAAQAPPAAQADLGLLATAAAALVLGAALASAPFAGAVTLLVAVAVAQAVLALAWVLGTGMPGRRGAIVIAALTAAGVDVATSLFPHGQLGAVVEVIGLAVVAMFVHQLLRGAARVQLVTSLSAVALLVLAEVALAALLQLRHEFGGTPTADRVVAAVAGAAAAGVLVGALFDTVLPVPRFDASVPRGLLGLVASTGAGAAVGHLLLRSEQDFGGGRGLFLGGALGALAGLIAVAAAFVLHSTSMPGLRAGRLLRPVIGAALPLCFVAPAGFLLALAVRP